MKAKDRGIPLRRQIAAFGQDDEIDLVSIDGLL